MMTYTPADEILRELRDLHQFINELLASPDKASWHWPSYYLLYVDMDRMAWRIRAAKTVFEEEPATGQAEWVDSAFAEFGNTQRSIVSWLWQISRNLATVVEDRTLRQRLRAHFQPKSEWYQVFRSDYCPGRVSTDGKTLERTILKTDPAPPDRIHDLGEKNLYARQCFDIGTSAARTSLAQAIARVEEEHAQVERAMTAFFLAHCSIDKLLHPSSV